MATKIGTGLKAVGYATPTKPDNNDEAAKPVAPELQYALRPPTAPQVQTDPGIRTSLNREVQPVTTPPWMRPGSPTPDAPTHIASVAPPHFSARQVMEQNPEFVSALRDAIRSRVGNTPTDQHGPFEKMFSANPEGASAAIAARFMEILRPFEGDRSPTFDQALGAKLRANEMFNWLNWTKR